MISVQALYFDTCHGGNIADGDTRALCPRDELTRKDGRGDAHRVPLGVLTFRVVGVEVDPHINSRVSAANVVAHLFRQATVPLRTPRGSIRAPLYGGSHDGLLTRAT